MSSRRVALIWILLASALGPAVAVSTTAGVAEAAPGGQYRPGMRVRAKRTCTVQGYEVKKGVVLSVVAVQTGDKGKTVAVDLSFSGMAISNVPAAVVDGLFTPA